MFPIILLEPRAKLLQLPQQAKRRTLNLQHSCFGSGWHYDGRVAWLSGEHGHLTKTILQIYLANSSADAPIIVDVHIKRTTNENVKSITSPVSLMNDFFTGAVDQQMRIRPNLLAGIVPAIDDQFKVQLILKMIIVFLNQLRNDAAPADGFENCAVMGYFARHKQPTWLNRASLESNAAGSRKAASPLGSCGAFIPLTSAKKIESLIDYVSMSPVSILTFD